jgi:hypothetical protein
MERRQPRSRNDAFRLLGLIRIGSRMEMVYKYCDITSLPPTIRIWIGKISIYIGYMVLL